MLVGILTTLRNAYDDDLLCSPRDVSNTPMTAIKSNVPPSSTLVMTVLEAARIGG